MKIKLFFLPLICIFLSIIPFVSHAETSIGYSSFKITRNYTRNGEAWINDVQSFSFSDPAFVIAIISSDQSNPYKTADFYAYSFSAFTVSKQGSGVVNNFSSSSNGLYGGVISAGTYVSGQWPSLGEVYSATFGPCYIVYSYAQADAIIQGIIDAQALVDGLGDFEGDEDGNIDEIITFPDPDEWEPNYDIPNPVVSWNGLEGVGGKWALFHCENAKSGYYIEVRGAVYTFNDFHLIRKNLHWYNYYDSVYWLTNNGHVRWETYIAPSDMQSAYVDGNISTGPVPAQQVGDLQSITSSGPYQVLNNLTAADEVSKVGYSNCLGYMHNNPLVWVGHKIYLRYFTYVDGVVQYSKWTPYDFPIAKSGSNAYTNLSEDPYIDEPDGGEGTDQDPDPDPDQLPDQDTDGGGDDGNNHIPQIDDVGGIFSSIINWLNDIIEGLNSIDSTVINFFNSSVAMLGQFPVLLARTFQFLPSWLISAISIGLAISIILRVFGR